jgi:hypothetical protein
VASRTYSVTKHATTASSHNPSLADAAARPQAGSASLWRVRGPPRRTVPDSGERMQHGSDQC